MFLELLFLQVVSSLQSWLQVICANVTAELERKPRHALTFPREVQIRTDLFVSLWLCLLLKLLLSRNCNSGEDELRFQILRTVMDLICSLPELFWP